jgi:hypothetical protein
MIDCLADDNWKVVKRMKTGEVNGQVPAILMLTNYPNPTTNVKRYFPCQPKG